MAAKKEAKTPAKKKTEKPAEPKPVFDKVLRVSAEIDTFIREYAEKKGVTVNEATDTLLATAKGRLEALAKYNGKLKDKAPAKPAAKKPAAKKDAAPRKRAPKADAAPKPAAV